MMLLDGEQYYNFIVDMIDNRKWKSYKTSTGFLLSRLCEKYDGLGNFVVNFLLQLIEYQISNTNSGENVPLSIEKFNYLKEVSLDKAFQGLNQEQLIDTALLELSLLPSFITKIPQNLNNLRVLLEKYSNAFYNVNSYFIKNRLCLLYGLYLDEVYKNEEEVEKYYFQISEAIEFLFIQLFVFKEAAGVSYQAAHALNQLIYYKGYTSVTDKIVKRLMARLIENIKEIEIVLFFDVLIDIILYLDVEDHIMHLCKEVSARILKEIKSPKKKAVEEKANVYINKCITILRTVLDKYKFINQINNIENNDGIEVVIESDALDINEFEKIIEPIVGYLKNPSKIEFDDELMLLMNAIVSNAKKVTPLSRQVFLYLPKYIEKHEGMTNELYEFLNLLIIYNGNDTFLQEDKNINTMIELIKASLEEVEDDHSQIYGAILIDIWLQAANNLPGDVVENLIDQDLSKLKDLYDIYRECLDDMNLGPDVYLFSTLITSLYAGLINYPYIVLKTIISKGLFKDFISWTELTNRFSFFSTYQSKVYII